MHRTSSRARTAALACMIAMFAASGAVAQEVLRPLCTDRPTKSTAPCTVDAGHLQIESDVVNLTLDRTGGIDTDTWLATNPTVKFGVSRSLDLEAGVAPLVIVSTRDRTTGARGRVSGIGDLFVRAKLNLAGDDGGTVGVALAPYVKVPTAKAGIGNGAVEAGIIAPISISLPRQWSLSLAPEIDWLADKAGAGRHANLINLVGLSRPFGPLTASAELWSGMDFDPAGETRQYSFDLGLAWIPKRAPNLQLDGGVNLGLNRVTPGAQAYVGISRRF